MKILMVILFSISFSVQAKEVERLVAVDGYNNLMHNKPQATINAVNVPSKNYIGK